MKEVFLVGEMSKFGEDFLVGEQNKFGEDGERLREDRASFLLGLASGLYCQECQKGKAFAILPVSIKVVQSDEALD